MGRSRSFKFIEETTKNDFLRSIYMMDYDEIGWSSAEILVMFDIILWKNWNINIYIWVVFWLYIFRSHTQSHTIGVIHFWYHATLYLAYK